MKYFYVRDTLNGNPLVTIAFTTDKKGRTFYGIAVVSDYENNPIRKTVGKQIAESRHSKAVERNMRRGQCVEWNDYFVNGEVCNHQRNFYVRGLNLIDLGKWGVMDTNKFFNLLETDYLFW